MCLQACHKATLYNKLFQILGLGEVFHYQTTESLTGQNKSFVLLWSHGQPFLKRLVLITKVLIKVATKIQV